MAAQMSEGHPRCTKTTGLGHRGMVVTLSSFQTCELIPPIALAYIGDAVYEVANRQYRHCRRPTSSQPFAPSSATG